MQKNDRTTMNRRRKVSNMIKNTLPAQKRAMIREKIHRFRSAWQIAGQPRESQAEPVKNENPADTHGYHYPIYLDYPPASKNEPRWGYGKPAHPEIYDILNKGRNGYEKYLNQFLDFADGFVAINLDEDPKALTKPYLSNPWLPGLDSLALYCFLGIFKPETYMEVGSGNSTKFATQSVRDNKLSTTIISIDPQPRAEVDELCKEIIRKPLEDVDLCIFDQLKKNDILFVDCSHRSFMNSDATVVFTEILPRLKPGVIMQIHDIFLPLDYPPEWADWYLSEQYLLACYLLAGGKSFDTLMPNGFVSYDKELMKILDPIFSLPDMDRARPGGGSFWLVKR